MRRDSETFNKKDVSSEDRFRRSRSGSPNENGDRKKSQDRDGRDSPKDSKESRDKIDASGDAIALKQVDGNTDEKDEMDAKPARRNSEENVERSYL